MMQILKKWAPSSPQGDKVSAKKERKFVAEASKVLSLIVWTSGDMEASNGDNSKDKMLNLLYSCAIVWLIVRDSCVEKGLADLFV